MSDEFNAGDVVKLKSGGPKMTVVATDLPGVMTVRCSWFAGAKHESGSFPTHALVLFEDEPMALIERPIAIVFLLLTVYSVWRLGFRPKPKIFQEP